MTYKREFSLRRLTYRLKKSRDGAGEIPDVPVPVVGGSVISSSPLLLSGRSHQNLDPGCILGTQGVFDFIQIKRLAGCYGESDLSFAAIRLDRPCLYPR